MNAPTPEQLADAYRRTDWEARGISFEHAMDAPDLLAALRASAIVTARRIARLAARGVGARIERTTPAHDD